MYSGGSGCATTANRTLVPDCDEVCQDVVAFWSSGILLGKKEDMDDIVNAILKVHENREKRQAV